MNKAKSETQMVESPNTIIQIPNAKMADNFIPIFAQGNVCRNQHGNKAPTAGAALRKPILQVHQDVLSKMVTYTATPKGPPPYLM
jgi:hypothetical protein